MNGKTGRHCLAAMTVWCALTTGLGTAGLASADPIHGKWVFQTDIAEKGCTITGEMLIDRKTPDAEAQRCQFISRESCGYDDPVPTQMEQSCIVIAQQDILLIRSEVTGSLTRGVPVEAYLPDHFTLTNVSSSQMSGIWNDRLYRDRVRFWRPEPVPVS